MNQIDAISSNEQQWKLLVLMLKEIADKKQISQLEIAEKSGLIPSNVSRFFALKYCPNLNTFLLIAKSVGVNFFFEDKDSITDLSVIFERAMTELGRRPNNLPTN